MRVGKPQTALERRENVLLFINNDIFDQQFSSYFFENQNSRIQEYFLSLINSLANDFKGRCYIISKDNLIQNLIHIFSNEKTETFIRQVSLFILQKLSLRLKVQDILISQDMIEVLVNILSTQINYLSENSLEYLIALLLNLCLRSHGKDAFEEFAEETISILMNLIDHSIQNVRTYVNCIMYSLLHRHTFKQVAIKINLKEKLEYMINQTNNEESKK